MEILLDRTSIISPHYCHHSQVATTLAIYYVHIFPDKNYSDKIICVKGYTTRCSVYKIVTFVAVGDVEHTYIYMYMYLNLQLMGTSHAYSSFREKQCRSYMNS